MAGTIKWSDDHEFELDGVTYRSMGSRTEPSQMVLLKTPPMVEGYASLIAELAPQRILELGIYSGGSTALLAQLARPEKLVAVDIMDGCAPLEQFIHDHDLGDVVAPYYGVDQADGERLQQVLAAEFGGRPLDLVVDDASHRADATRASFNRLFPHLHPGGAYLIEDWSWAHHRVAHPERTYHAVEPLSAFVCELVLASACRPRVIAEVRVHEHWALVRRGIADLDPEVFDLKANFDSVGREMVERLQQVRSLGAGGSAEVLTRWRSP